MKKKLLVVIAMITLLIMSGCGNKATVEDQIVDDNQVAEQAEEVQDNTEAFQDNTEAFQEEDVDLGELADKADQISEKDAKAIVLKHAGLREEDVEFTKFEKDKDDGIWKYEIEFISGDKEYEYDVRMSDGKILEYDVDSAIDD